MGRGRSRKRGRKRPHPPTAGGAAGAVDLEARVRGHLESGQAKRALEAAKILRKQQPGRAADALYLEACEARVLHLFETHQITEAQQLVNSVRERFPEAAGWTRGLGMRSELRAGRPDEVLRELARDDLDPGRKQEICDLIMEELRDPACVAECDAVPEDHWTRREARAVHRAIDRTTSAPCPVATLARETAVPRKSPFAPWKLLALAIEAAYAGDVRALDHIEREMPARAKPAALLPPLRALATNAPGTDLGPAQRRLLDEIRGEKWAVSSDIEDLDDAVRHGRSRLAFRLARRVDERLRHCAPTQRPDYHRLLYVAWMESDHDHPDLLGFLRDAEPGEAYRCAALAFGGFGAIEHAIDHWEEYLEERGSALSAVGVSLVRLRQASLAARALEPNRYGADGGFRFPFGHTFETASPSEYLEMAVKAHPTPETYKALVGALVATQSRAAEDTAQEWRECFPQDVQPVLFLMRAAEKRGAIRKALRFLECAEELGPTHAEVRTARFRLLLEGARYRLKNAKAHLAARDLEALATLPRATERPVRVLLGALRWCIAAMGESEQDRIASWSALVDEIGEGGGALLLHETVEYVGLRKGLRGLSMPRIPSTMPAAEAAESLAVLERAFATVDREFHGGHVWAASILEGLSNDFEPASEDLEPLCRWAHRRGDIELLFHLSGIGLRRAGPRRYRFLLHRARSLPAVPANVERRTTCLRVARALARRARDDELDAEVARELHHEVGVHSFLDWLVHSIQKDASHGEPDPEEQSATLEEEAAARIENTEGSGSRSRRSKRGRKRKTKAKATIKATIKAAIKARIKAKTEKRKVKVGAGAQGPTLFDLFPPLDPEDAP